MPKLFGAQRVVLQAILDLPKDVADNVTDLQIAQATQIALGDVRDWLETLDGDGNVNIVRTTAGLSASITAQGKLALKQFQPLDHMASDSGRSAAERVAGVQDGNRSDLVIDSSGKWVLLHENFFEARLIKQSGGTIRLVIPSCESKDDSALQALGSPQRGGPGSIAYAHRNDALVVNIQDVESESEGDGHVWTVTLKPKEMEYGGHFAEAATSINSKHYAVEEIAQLRASVQS
jgi:hypothetical protein